MFIIARESLSRLRGKLGCKTECSKKCTSLVVLLLTGIMTSLSL